jgi:DNA sulfur modification protein DndB
MKVKFPAMQAVIGQRTYYACVMKLAVIPKMFTFRDWIEFTPEDREQRVLNKDRIPDIARYILDNEDGYLFASITASYKCATHFEPVNTDGHGFLEMDFQDANFVINDGQHRCAAIAHAIKANPAIGEESISVLLFPYESKERVQQMFSDLNRYVQKPPRPLNILFDQRDSHARVTLEVCEKVPAFQGLVDKENVSLPARSEKAFTLASLYDATQELLAEQKNGENEGFHELVATAVEYWTTVSKFMPDWWKVKDREIRPIELRQENISTHSVVLRALGGIGADILKRYPSDWKVHLADLVGINWNKKNRDWENVCMVANSVVANRQARLATKAYLKRKLGLPVSESEGKSIEPLIAREDEASTRAGLTRSMTQNGVNGPPSASERDYLNPPRKRAPIHPTEVRIGDVPIWVRRANEVPVVVANWILQQGRALRRMQNFVHEMDSGFSASAQTKRLDNGWFIEVGDSQETLLLKGRRLLDACGFSEVTLKVVLEDGTARTA